jgi:hypothetical protein
MGGALEYEGGGGAVEGVINNIQVSIFVCSIFLKTRDFFFKEHSQKVLLSQL